MNFVGVYLILRIFNKALIVETATCNYISIGLISMGVYAIMTVVTGVFIAFMVSRVQMSAVYVKTVLLPLGIFFVVLLIEVLKKRNILTILKQLLRPFRFILQL